MKNIFYASILIFSLLSCSLNGDIKEIRDFKDAEWFSNKPQTFEIDVKDLKMVYSFKYLIRNAVSYPFYNLYLDQKLIDPSGKIVKATTDEIILFDEKTGQPLGDGLGDIFDHKSAVPELRNVVFPVVGKYKWVITHKMRPDPLAGLMSIGVEITKSERK